VDGLIGRNRRSTGRPDTPTASSRESVGLKSPDLFGSDADIAAPNPPATASATFDGINNV